jgi:signal transduction histidine kinase
MTDIFGGVRWRMVGWSILVLSVILAATGAVLYVSLNRTLMSSVDAQLQSASASAEMELVESSGISDLQREGYQSGLLYLVIASDGTVVANPQGIGVDSVPPDLLSGRSQAFETIAVEGSAVRLFAQQVPEPGGDSLTLVVGTPLAPVQAAANDLLLTLLLCGAVGLALSFLGAWFLAARALVPVQGAFERQQEFVADASHELRTPLTILHSTADLLAREPQPNAKLVLEMREEIVRMERLTRDLLTLARSDRGELHLSVGRLELGALARDLARRVGLLAEARGSKVELSVPDAPVRVEADPDRLQEVGLILLDNALRHAPPGGTISITVGQRPGSGLLVVEDTGEGIPEEHLTRVFERFHRVDPSRDRRSGGAGLGLAIAHTIIAAHGGTISITRRAEGGTRVAIRLPLLTADRDLDESPRGGLSGARATR